MSGTASWYFEIGCHYGGNPGGSQEDRDLKVLQINTVCGSGSVGRITVDIVHALEEAGDEGMIAFGRRQAPEGVKTWKFGTNLDMGVHVLHTFFKGEHGFASSKQTARLIEKIKEYDPDIIHLHNIHGFYLDVEQLFRYLKTSGKPVVWTLHDCWSFTGHCAHFDYIGCMKWKTGCGSCPQYKNVYPYALFKDNSAGNYKRKKDAFTGVPDLTVVTPSRWLAGYVRESYLGEYPVQVIPNGIALDRFRPVNGGLRKRLGFENKYILLGVASMWEERKGYAYFEQLADRLDDSYQIILIGLSKRKLKTLHPRIHGVMRTNSMEELAEYYSMADAYVNTTLEDTFPTTNLEALACGTPVITFATGGSVESVDASCGKIVPKGDIEALIQAIEELRGEPDKKEACLRRAAGYDKDDRFQDYLKLYRSLLERQGRQAVPGQNTGTEQ
ncbi:glycosyltransferase [Lachnoclostridium sp. An131]|uniref:glycosyltransferase n=1 Tax=Lachnoclostridium sp. An131 TaxID=1965555 RepID=UPI001952277B|nr:glycosyltransferase [Lachnoclostridium sp. An131]